MTRWKGVGSVTDRYGRPAQGDSSCTPASGVRTPVSNPYARHARFVSGAGASRPQVALRPVRCAVSVSPRAAGPATVGSFEVS